MRTLAIGSLLVFALTACGKNDPCVQMVEAADAAEGVSCSAGSDCPSIPCACEDGSQVDTSSCFNGVCQGLQACVDVCGEIRECAMPSDSNSNSMPSGQFACVVPSGADPTTVMCDAATEYCLGSWTGTANLTGPECTPKPSGCNDCDCLSDDARAQFPTSNNCDSLVSCSGSTGFSVLCQQ